MTLTFTTTFPDDDLLELEAQMAERIPSGVFILRAVPVANGKYHAMYSAPGLIPAIAETADGRPYEYNTEQEAEWGAAKSLIGILNSPRIRARQSQGKPERYEKLTGAQFAVLLQRAGLTPTFFAELYGTTPKRVLDWIDDVESVPHPVRIVLELFIADKRNIDIAERTTNAVTTARRAPRTEETR